MEFMLCEIIGSWDIGGIICLAAIPCLMLISFLYSANWFIGSCSCFGIFILWTCLTLTPDQVGGPGSEADKRAARECMISNLSQSKFIWYKDLDLRERDDLEVYRGPMYIYDGPDYDFNSKGELFYSNDLKYHFESRGEDMNGMWVPQQCFVFIPENELEPYNINQKHRVMKGGREIVDDDYYVDGVFYSPVNVPAKFGGLGIPDWVYNHACVKWLFGIASLPCIIAIAFIKKVFGL